MRLAPLVSLTLCAFAATLVAQERPEPLDQPTADELTQGRRLYDAQCSGCHGIGGAGGRGPSLNRARLRHAPDDAALVAVLQDGIPGTGMSAAWQLSDRELVEVVAYVRSLGRIEPEALPGDAARGRELFLGKAACTACHIVEGVGSGLGPDLTDVGARRGGRHLRESLLDPGASRPEWAVPFEPRSIAAYLVVDAITGDGREIRGHRVNEDTFTIQLRDAEGRLHSLRKADLVSLEKPPAASPMPSYRDTLEPDEVDDLVAFLASLKGEQ